MEFVPALGLLALVLTLAALSAGLVERAPLSFPMVFLALGFFLGPGGMGVLDMSPRDQSLEVISTITLALVLFLDAVNLERARSRHEWLAPALSLGPGTALIIIGVAGTAMVLLDFSPLLAFLLGAVLASTDPVVLRDVVRDTRIPLSVRRALSIEAGTNDMVVLPVVLILVAVARRDFRGGADWLIFGVQLFLLGPAAGFAVGAAGSWIMARMDARIGIRREYQALYGIGLVLGSYAAGVGVGGDGFLAAFAGGFAVTVLDQQLCDCFLEFGQAAAEMAMLLAFVMFGALLSTASALVPLAPTLLLAGIVIFVARPAAIWPLLSFRALSLSRPARAFIAWFGPRGLNSLLFALIVIRADVVGADLLLAATGVVVVVSVVVHGASSTPVSRWYGRRLAEATLPEERRSTAAGIFEPDRGAPDRITPDELAQKLQGDDPPLVVDVRSRSQYELDDDQIPGSIRVLPDRVSEWAENQNQKRPIVLYCT